MKRLLCILFVILSCFSYAGYVELGTVVPLDFKESKTVIYESKSGYFFEKIDDYIVGYKVVGGVLLAMTYEKENSKSISGDEIHKLLQLHSKKWGVTNSLIPYPILISPSGYYAHYYPNYGVLSISKITFKNEIR